MPDFPRDGYRKAGTAQPEEDRHYRGGGPATPWSSASPACMASVHGLSLEPSRRRTADCSCVPSCIFSNHQPGRDPLSRRVPLPPTIRLLFRRWRRPEFLRSGNPLRVPQPTITVTTDASHIGWGGGGGHCMGRYAYGDWSRYRVLPQINVLEFQAVILSLHHFVPLVRHRTVLIRTDFVTVAAYIYINKQGGTHSARLNALAAELWTWCGRRDIIPTASYIPGQYNIIADFLSRGRVLPSEWTLHPQVMAIMLRTFGPLHVDLFASVLYAQLRRYCT